MDESEFFKRAFADRQFLRGKLDELSVLRQVTLALGLLAVIGGSAFCIYTKIYDDCWTTGFPLLTLAALCGGLYTVCGTRMAALQFIGLLSGLSDETASTSRRRGDLPPGPGDV